MARKNAAEILLKFRAENGEGLRALDQVNKKLADTEKASTNVYGRLAEINRGKEIDNLGQVYGTLSAKTGEAAKQADALASRLAEIGASEDEIKRAADQFERFEAAQLESDSASGGGKKNTFGLRSFGSELKALPAVQIPGLPVSTDAIGKITQLFGNLTPTAIAAGGAVGLASGALAVLTTNANKAREALGSELEARDRALTLLRQGSDQEVQARINELTAKKKINEEIKALADSQVDQARQQTIATKGGAAALVNEINSVLGTGGNELAALKTEADKAAKAVGETNLELDLLTQYSGKTAQSIDEVAAAMQRAQFIGSDIANRAAADLEAYQLVNDTNATTKQLDERLRNLQLEYEVTKNSADAARYRAESLGLETIEGKAAQAEVENLTKKQNAAQTSIEVLSQSFVRTAVAANELAAAQEQIRKDSITATKKYDDDVAKAEEDNLKQRAEIQDKYNDAIVKAADAATDAAIKALDKLQGQQDKLELALTRGESTIEQKAEFDAAKKATERARTEVKDAQDHAAKLREIRLKSQEDDENLIAKRDFAGLYRSRRATTVALQAENDRYTAERTAKLVAYAEQDEDAAKQRAFERQQRLQKYQQDLSDAQTAYNTDIRNAAAARDKAIQLAVQTRDKEYQAQYDKYTSTLNLLKAGIVAELQLIEKGNAGKLALEERYYAQSRTLLAGAVTAANLGGNINGKAAGLAFKAKGGGLRKGQLAAVNEPGSTGREGFNRIAFPRMAGLFMPMQAGTVNRDTGKPSINNVWNITGNDPEAIGAVVERKVGEQLDYYFG